ncbi:MAG: leucine-rich repeat protein, partial [Bacilli bacterium]|nr:leucine-rich repeat protein [Bacilli bacterium]
SEVASYKVPHGSLLRDPGLLPSRDESELGDTEKYIFAGWSQNINGMVASSKSSAKVTQLNTILASQDMNWYPVYYKGSVYSSVLDDKFLTFTNGTGVDYINNVQTSGLVLSFNRYHATDNPDGYDPAVLNGKITLPSYHNGVPIVRIADSAFLGCNNVTHIFFENNNPSGDCQVVEFGRYSFNAMTGLKKIYFPDSLKTLNPYCLANTTSLELTDIGGNINMINQYAFAGAGAQTFSDDLYLGGNIVWLAPKAFNNYYSGIKTLYVGSQTEPSQISEYDSDHQYAGNQNGSIIFSSVNAPTNGIVVYCSSVDKSYFDNWTANNLYSPGYVSNINVRVV